jgi:DASS family divalent anion:Na+ symporter
MGAEDLAGSGYRSLVVPAPSRSDRPLRWVVFALPAFLAWITTPPAVLDANAWRLLGLFASAIAGFIAQPVPMGPAVLLALVVAGATGVLLGPDGASTAGTLEAAMSGYGEEVVWLVVGAFLLSSALQSTGLGRRIALSIVVRLGRSTLGLGYAQALAELVLGPVVPSNTARGGGILAPITGSLSTALDSHPHESPRAAGEYLCLVGAHTNLITSAMFLTGMAANALLSRAAEDVYGVEFGWTRWALAGIVPGLAGLALLPWLLHWLVRPTVTDGRPAQARAREELAAMGPMSASERVTLCVFALMLALWTTKSWHGMGTTLVAWIGVVTLLVAGARTWRELVDDGPAWDALIWLGGLLALANGLRDQGVVDWFATGTQDAVAGWPMLPTLLGLAAAYFYSMYGFSMLTAHISAMAAAFLLVCSAAEVPPLLAVPLFAAFSNLCGCTTNYSTGPFIIYFGLGYVPTERWFRVGFFVSLFHFAVWVPLGLGWWKLLGWW